MFKSLAQSLGVSENTARLQQHFQREISAQADNVSAIGNGVAKVSIWSAAMAVTGFFLTATVLLIAFLVLVEYMDAVLAAGLIGLFLAILLAICYAGFRSSLSRVPAFRVPVVPDLYIMPDSQPTAPPLAASMRPTPQAAGPAESSMSAWLVSSVKDAVPYGKIENSDILRFARMVEPQTDALIADAVDTAATHIQSGNRTTVWALLLAGVASGIVASRLKKP